jgi:hypothetical protein
MFINVENVRIWKVTAIATLVSLENYLILQIKKQTKNIHQFGRYPKEIRMGYSLNNTHLQMLQLHQPALLDKRTILLSSFPSSRLLNGAHFSVVGSGSMLKAGR